MASTEPVLASQRLRTAAVAERGRLLRDLTKAEERAAELRLELGALEATAHEIRRRLALLAQLAHDEDKDSAFPVSPSSLDERAPLQNGASAGSVAPERGFLTGVRIRVEAIRVLASTASPARAIHYAEWYRLLTEAGFAVAGRDPLATFLTQLGRSPLVRRSATRGVYALDLDAPKKFRDRLRRLHEELICLHEGQQTIDAISSLRERRALLTSECARVERALEEMKAALGEEIETLQSQAASAA